MTTLAIRKSLQEYIRFADERKIKALYTIIEKELNEEKDIWTKEFIAEMKFRFSELETKKTKGVQWEKIQEKAKRLLKSSKK